MVTLLEEVTTNGCPLPLYAWNQRGSEVISMLLTPPKRVTWNVCVLLWILGVILAFGIRKYAVVGSALLALSGLLLILAVYLKGL